MERDSRTWLLGSLVGLLLVWLTRAVLRLWKLVAAIEKLNGAPLKFPSGTVYAHPSDHGVMTYVDNNLKENPAGASRMWYGILMPYVNLHRPEDLKKVITRHSPKASLVYKFVRAWLGPKSVLLLEGEKWKATRQLLDPAFHRILLKNYSQMIVEATEDLCDKFARYAEDPDQEVDVAADFSALTLDVILRCAFSYKSGCQTNPGDDFSSAINTIDHLVAHRYLEPWHFFDFIYNRSEDGRKFNKYLHHVHSYATNLMERRRKELQGLTLEDISRDKRPSGRALFDFLDICLLSRDESGNPALTDEEIRSQCDTFLFAGHDTTSAALSWITFCLSRHQEYQNQCRDELFELFGDTPPQFEELSNLPFTSACIKEAMRLYPPVPGVARVLEKPLTLECGVELQPGTPIGCAMYAIHRNPLVWEEPEKFDPTRFIGRRHDIYSFFPFSVGNRNCIGSNFALNEIRIVLCQLLRRFRFLPVDYEPRLEATLVLKSENGVNVRMEKLQDAP